MRKLTSLQFDDQQDQALLKDIQDAATNYLINNHEHRYADVGMFAKLILLSLLTCGFYVGCLLCEHALWYFVICYFLFIFMAMLLAVNVVHDASHNVFFKTPKANRWLNRIITIPLGIDPDCWQVRHVAQHHPYTNIEHYDFDIDYNGFLRQTPYQRRHWYMRYQQYYWPFIAAMTFPTIIWFFDWQDRLGIKFEKNKFTENGAYNGLVGWLLFFIPKMLHLTITIILPILFCEWLNLGIMLIIYLLSQMFSSMIFVMLLLGTHWAKATFYPIPKDGKMQHSQVRHTFDTSLNWRLKHPLFEYWIGGLNLHLTHHLYPGFCHRHYYELTIIIHQIAKKHGIPCQDITLSELFYYQQKFLKNMGKKQQ